LEESDARTHAELRYWPEATAEGDRLRDEGPFFQLMAFRLRATFGQYTSWRYFIPGDPLMMFLIGMLAVRLRVFQEPLRYKKLLLAVIVIGAIAGVSSQLAALFVHFDAFESARLGLAARRLTFAVFDERLQGLAYAAALLLWMASSDAGQRLGRWLSYPGRLSLTNYVVQVTILEIFFATSHPIGPLNRWTSLVGVIVVFAAQVFFSRWWIGRFRFGPLEWLWRCITFARWEPLRREQAGSATA
jgi:uncharacterized protein